MRSKVSAGMLCVALAGGCRHTEAPLAPTRYAATGLGTNPLRGDLVPVHDPSLAREGSTWYAFTTDLPFLHDPTYISVRCSTDLSEWQPCGHVFDALPIWVTQKIPGVRGLWAPEVAYFDGVYHLYYAASTFGSQRSVIGLTTNTTLDPRAPGYRWVDQGEVLESQPGDDFNAIDPAVLVEPQDGREPEVWLAYGSFWTGIKQRRLDPSTGKSSGEDTRIYSLAARPFDRSHAIEGASMIKHDGWFYLFASVGICCAIPIERDTYREIVGSSRSVHGPFVGEDGSQMITGGGTVLLDSDALWLAPGGGSAYTDPKTGQTLLTFHALRRSQNGALFLWIKRAAWQEDWPVFQDP